MDIITTPPYEEMQALYNKYFSLEYLGKDINNKFAIISLTCYLKMKLSEKKPDVTHFSILRKIAPNVPEDLIKKLAVICSDFAYGCTSFPTFGITDKNIPAEIKELLEMHFPF